MFKAEFNITREKHLDHMVRVVPFIVTAYAIQCYFIRQMASIDFGVDGLLFLGGCLVFMIGCFITYDLTHSVKFSEASLEIGINWLKYHKVIQYDSILEITVSDPGQSFATLKISTKDGKKYGFYFIDDADKIKKWLEQKHSSELPIAA